MRFRALAALSTMAVAASVSVLAATPAQAMPLQYAALGDSYASGVGAGDYQSGNDCYRSAHAYSQQIAWQLSETLWFDACSGAKTADVSANQLSHLSGAVEHVTVGVGGNDVGFSTVLGACAGTDTALCLSVVEGAKAQIRDVLPGRLDALYSEISARATQASIVAVGNPRLFSGATCAASLAITPEEQTALNEAADLLAETTKTVATAHGFGFADPRDAFIGHAVCSADPYILGYVPGSNVESFHPTRAGQDAYTDVVLAKL
ncbi:SGNH/GDSL hydrolase family protein [Phytomonospora sp. NPDC050363]|uniref:SGNH/GDSL hydrolase family protein n=1 Tax=Phytomonospora sp. NPDC050363 TaxID=3155642 RepID=UPI0033D0DA1E